MFCDSFRTYVLRRLSDQTEPERLVAYWNSFCKSPEGYGEAKIFDNDEAFRSEFCDYYQLKSMDGVKGYHKNRLFVACDFHKTDIKVETANNILDLINLEKLAIYLAFNDLFAWQEDYEKNYLFVLIGYGKQTLLFLYNAFDNATLNKDNHEDGTLTSFQKIFFDKLLQRIVDRTSKEDIETVQKLNQQTHYINPDKLQAAINKRS